MNRRDFITTSRNTLARYLAAETPAKKAAVLSGETVKGIKWAILFAKSLDHDFMTETEFNHAVRLLHFRGSVCPQFRG